MNAGATDALDVSGQNSPVLRANPTDPANLVVANRIDSPAFSCALRASFDGGATWAETPIAFPEGVLFGCFAPDAAFGPDGTLYLSFTTISNVAGLGTVPEGVWTASSPDGGRSLSAPTRAFGALAFQARLAADARRPGRLYLCWLQGEKTTSWGFAGEGRPIVVSRSDDGGATWAEPVPASSPARRRAVAPSVATGGGGEVYVAYLDVGGDRLDYSGAHEGVLQAAHRITVNGPSMRKRQPEPPAGTEA